MGPEVAVESQGITGEALSDGLARGGRDRHNPLLRTCNQGGLGGLDMGDFSVQQIEESGRENGIRYWYAHEFMASLGYDTWAAFQT